jgi:hydantoinase/carbamoylase family amidase
MKDYIQLASRVKQRINEFTFPGDDNTRKATNKTYGSPAFVRCSNRITQWMLAAGLDTRTDSIGNVRGKFVSSNPEAKTLVIASHFAPNAYTGKYDGMPGILIAIGLVEGLKEKNISLPFHIEVIAFCGNEDGRFHIPYPGSHVVAGSFKNKWLDACDDKGISLQETLQILNYNSARIKEDAIASKDWLAYYEIHIEQGSSLYEKNIPVGIASDIAGQKIIEIIFTGETGYAGATAMNNRKDALAAAAKFITGVEKYASKEKRNIVATVGSIHIDNASSYQVPGKVRCTLDLRTYHADALPKAYEEINELCEKVCTKRNIYFEWKLIHETEPVACSKKLRKLLSNAIADKKIEVTELVSGGGLNASIISRAAPVSALFIRCFRENGRHLTENIEVKDIATALEVSHNFIGQLIQAVEEKEFKKNKSYP